MFENNKHAITDSMSPSRMRRTKSRHRRNNSLSRIDVRVEGHRSSSVKSPTKEALHNELEFKTAAIRANGDVNISPSSFKYLGPGTAIREKGMFSEQESDVDHPRLHRLITKDSSNLNDVCFGCDGRCKDPECRTRRTLSEADIEIGIDKSRVVDPKAKGHDNDQANMNIGEGGAPREEGVDSDNGNSQSNSPVKRIPRSPKSGKAPKSPKSPGQRGKKFKRLRSTGDTPDESPNKKGNTRTSSENLEGEKARAHHRVNLLIHL